MHLFIFWGWVVLFIGTLIIAVHADVVYFLEGRVYLAYSAILDVFGIVALIGLSMALLRRYVLKPPRLRLGSLWDDDDAALAHVRHRRHRLPHRGAAHRRDGANVSATITCARRRHSWTTSASRITRRRSSPTLTGRRGRPVGYALAKLFDCARRQPCHDARHAQGRLVGAPAHGAALDRLDGLRQDLAHHPWLRPTSSCATCHSPQGIIAGSTLAPIKDFETAESFGAGYLADFSWKQLMDADVCVRCGRCEVNCPATISGKELSPMGCCRTSSAYLQRDRPVEAGGAGEGRNRDRSTASG